MGWPAHLPLVRGGGVSSAISTSMYPTGDLNKYKFVVSTSMCISLLYELMKNLYICYCISITVICLL